MGRVYPLPVRVTVIIPTLNEQERVGAAIDSAFAAGADEVIVADGGSTDATVADAREHGARVIEGETMRSRQMNRAAAEATSEALVFLHADTRLPAGACTLIARAVDGGAVFGGFRLQFTERSLRLRVAAALINFRTRFTRCPWGDQAQFVSRNAFLESGAFREIPIMEDYELATRMKRRGRSVVLPQKVTTSGRRFLTRGLLRTSFINWRIIIAWRLGADPEQLARIYRAQ
ncbi:MAG TPA: TIGR04283 family arsenosugar biosynthesis glycosyltransferase [Thermoanaerobaculia bacterium]|nr:TIGR04283 family arsenosugar biosynthesis glycosyltransferase [Thermoanaerobaculia bacterium]